MSTSAPRQRARLRPAARHPVFGSILCAALAVGCASTPRWQTPQQPDARDAASLLASDSLGLSRDQRPDEVPIIPVRKRLRPCCAFGSDLRVRVGPVPIPAVSIGNIRSADDIGTHSYDVGQRGQDIIVGNERNGLVYTCRGGFIDTAHVRDYADWTLYLATRIGRTLETGAVIDLPDDEGGHRRFVLQPVSPELIRIVGRRDLTAALAVHAGFQLSIWHEIATWYGWSSVDAFPERASAFSPEDLYSNLLGAKLVGPIISAGNDMSEGVYARAVDAWFAQSLRFLGAVDARLAKRVMQAVDQGWWDSSAHLPDAHLVRRRSMQLGTRIDPWIVPPERLSRADAEKLAAACGEDRAPHVLRNPSRIPGLDFAQILRFEIELDETFRAHPSLRAFGPVIEQAEFPELYEVIRAEMKQEFGPLADSPELP